MSCKDNAICRNPINKLGFFALFRLKSNKRGVLLPQQDPSATLKKLTHYLFVLPKTNLNNLKYLN